MVLLPELKNLWSNGAHSPGHSSTMFGFKWREVEITANLGQAPCMAAPVSHQSAKSLTEILKGPACLLPCCSTSALGNPSAVSVIVTVDLKWMEPKVKRHSYYHQSFDVFIPLSIRSWVMWPGFQFIAFVAGGGRDRMTVRVWMQPASWKQCPAALKRKSESTVDGHTRQCTVIPSSRFVYAAACKMAGW